MTALTRTLHELADGDHVLGVVVDGEMRELGIDIDRPATGAARVFRSARHVGGGWWRVIFADCFEVEYRDSAVFALSGGAA